MERHPDPTALHRAVRDAGARAATAVGLLGIGLVHLLDAIGKYGETRYLFWLYVALMLASVGAAVAVLFTRRRIAFLAAAGLAASAIAGYVLSRTTGLPDATGDIGNWTEPLGLASLWIESAVVLVAGGAWRADGRAATRPDPRRALAPQGA